ncbi:MAG: hypothetical protein JWQ98_43 [Chlorobi bacterium]|nr:hypothetical protein [Chlorobiota bacterium]
MTSRTSSILLACALLLGGPLFTGCTNDPIYAEKGIRVRTANLPAIGGDAYYELWFSYPKSEADPKHPTPDHEDAAYVSIGKFRVDDAGAVTAIGGGQAVFNTPAGYNPGLYMDAILTVESTGGKDTIPGPRMLSGAFLGTASLGRDTLTLAGGDAFGEPILGTIGGGFILDTPTNDSANPSANGIWFVRLADSLGTIGTAIPGLLLPSQPINKNNPDWTYQAWLVRTRAGSPTEYIPLGHFDISTAADSTAAGAGAGPFPGRIYPSPGEDFVTGTPRTLNDGTYGVIVSAEPTTIALGRPLLPMVTLDRIPAGVPPRTTLIATTPTAYPRIEVELDR